MTSKEAASDSMPEQRRIVLRSLHDLLERIGSANDAEDHGYGAEAEQMRKEACEAIRGLMREHAFLREMFSTLQWELDTQHILGFGWTDLEDSVEKFVGK